MKLKIALLCIMMSINLTSYTFAQKSIQDYKIEFSSEGTQYNYSLLDLSILFGIHPKKENLENRLNTKVTVFKIERSFIYLSAEGKYYPRPRNEPEYRMEAIFNTSVKQLLLNDYMTFDHKVPGILYDSIYTITLKASVLKKTSTIKIEIERIKETREFNIFKMDNLKEHL